MTNTPAHDPSLFTGLSAFPLTPLKGDSLDEDAFVGLIERLVLAGVDSIREVIAFPKSGGGVDPLTDAPAPITELQRKESGIDAKPEPAAAESE